MLQLFHKYQKYWLWLVLLSATTLAFTGFGYDLFQRTHTVHAVRLADKEVTFDQLTTKIRDIEARYRQMFGENFDKIAAQFGLNISQQVLDQTIAELLFDAKSKVLGLSAGKEEWQSVMRSEVFPNGYTTEAYKRVLAETGMNQNEFEQSVRDTVVRRQLANFIQDSSLLSLAEARAQLIRDETTYGVRYLKLSPATFEKQVTAPTKEQIESYYQEHQSEFEQPEKVSYRYEIIGTEQVLKEVPVSEDEVELTYTENQAKYSDPEQVKAKHIQLTFAKDKSPEKMAALKTRAEEALEKAKSGQPFETLVLEYSDDVPTKAIGGSLGVISRGKMAKEFDDAVFKLKSPGIAELVSTDYGYHIVKVEEYIAAKPKELATVKGEIEAELKLRDAPAFASEKAQQRYEEWTKSGSPLSEVAVKDNYQLKETSGELAAENDPDPALKGLSSAVLGYGEGEQKLIIELPKVSVLVEVINRIPVKVAELSEVSAQIEKKLRADAAQRLTQEKAAEIVTKLSKSEFKDLDAAAKSLGLTVEEKKGLKAIPPPNEAPFSDPELQRYLFSQVGPTKFAPASGADRSFAIGGSRYIVDVFEVKAPSEADVADKIKLNQVVSKGDQESAQTLQRAMIASLKAQAIASDALEVNPQAMQPR